jgi:hypothetical protein
MRRPASPLTHVTATDMPEDLRQLHAASLEVVGEAERIEVFAAHPDLYRWYHLRPGHPRGQLPDRIAPPRRA